MRIIFAILCALSLSLQPLESATFNHSDLQISGSVGWAPDNTSYLGSTPANTLSVYRLSGGLFKLEGASLSGSLKEIIKSGSSPNPLLAVAEPGDDLSVIQDFFGWQREGAVDFGFFRIEGFRAGNLIQSLSFSTVSPDMIFENFSFVDRLDIRIAIPEDFIFASFWNARGQQLQSNSYSCYYNCEAYLTVNDLSIAPIPIPATAVMLITALGGLGGLRILRRRNA